MANTSSAKKAIRQTKKRTVLNLAKKKAVKESVRAALDAIEANASDVQEKLNAAFKSLDKAAKTNVIHANKAARMKSRLQRKANK